MSSARRVGSTLMTKAAVVAALAVMAYAQDRPDTLPPKPSTLPNPYRLVPDWPTLPASMKGPNGHKWGEVIRVHLAPNGNVWVFQRCFYDKPAGDATCLNRGEANPPILEFNPAGRLLKSFGVGLFAHPHGFTVDTDGNIWTTDTNDAETILGMPAKNAQGVTMGQEVLKIRPDGTVLMTIGQEGVAGNGPYTFDRPTGVAVASNGDIFVADGHSRNQFNNARVVKYSPDGRFIKAWGRMGSEPGNFREPHDIYVGGSRGYVYVADRQNNRIQVFDQDGNFIAAWKQFGQPSSVYVDKHDNIFVGATYQAGGGSVTGPTTGANDRGIVIGNAITGELKYFIPDPGDLSKMTDTGTSASGIAEDDEGNIYAADVGENNLRKYAPLSAVGAAAQAPLSIPNGLPSWAFNIPDKVQPPTTQATGPIRVPGSSREYDAEKVANSANPPDWFPDEHGPAPRVVKGEAGAALQACGSCHLMSGQGHPESADIAALPAEYFVRQMNYFKSGARKDDTRMGPIARATSEEDSRQAAEYFAAIRPIPWVKVIETATPPKTYVSAAARHRLVVPGGGTEPIGRRIIETPVDPVRTANRDPHSPFLAYVPPGSIARGEALVKTGGSGKTIPCAICHGDQLTGLGEVPRIAGLQPVYIARQLICIQNGSSAGRAVALMKKTVSNLSEDDIISISAYLGSLAPQ